MKINPMNQTEPPVNRSSAGNTRGETHNTFNSIFEETVGRNEIASVGNPQPIHSLNGPSMAIPIARESTVVDCLSTTLDNLDQYRDMLGDGSISLRSMETSVRRLKADSAILESLLDGMPEDDAARPVTQETLLLVAKEIAHFEMGDYAD